MISETLIVLYLTYCPFFVFFSLLFSFTTKVLELISTSTAQLPLDKLVH